MCVEGVEICDELNRSAQERSGGYKAGNDLDRNGGDGHGSGCDGM